MPDAPAVKTPADRAMRTYIQQIRGFTRDMPHLNRLTAGVESGDRFIALAIQLAISDWNTTPPRLAAITVENHPAPELLIMKSIIYLLIQVGILQTRNHLSYSDGQGAMINASDKAPQIQSWIQLLSGEYEQGKRQKKIEMNITGAFGGGVHSELRLIGGFYGW